MHISRLWHSLLNADPGELRRVFPFFLLYCCLFAALTMADALSLSLFISQVPATELPYYYALAAFVSFLAIRIYTYLIDTLTISNTFLVILFCVTISFALTYVIGVQQPGEEYLGPILFVLREVSYTIILVHFATYLQQYFDNHQLRRLLPLIFSGGRFGGLLGAILLTSIVPRWGVIQTIPFFIALMVIALTSVALFHYYYPVISFTEEENSKKKASLGFMRDNQALITEHPLVRWHATSGFLFMFCRWLLVFQYSLVYKNYFTDPEAMTLFLAWYTKIALLISLLFQAILVSRVIQFWGLKHAHLIYNAIMTIGFFLVWLFPGIVTATWCRFVENELRFSWRNPVNQLVTNLYPPIIRIKARALTLGAVNPGATFVSAASIATLAASGAIWLIPGVSIFISATYLAATSKMYRSVSELSGSRNMS